MGRAIVNFLRDLFSGDPVALILTALFLLLFSIPAVIWLIDLLRRGKQDPKQSGKRRDFRPDKR
jgi:hypothetical protein